MPVMPIPSNIFRRIRPQIAQYEATTGRRIGRAQLEALYRAALETETSRALEAARLESDISARKQNFALRKQAIENARKAAKASGIAQLAGTAIQGGMLLKGTGTGKAITKGVKSLFGGAGAGTAGSELSLSVPGASTQTAPAFTGLPELQAGAGTGAGAGAQTQAVTGLAEPALTTGAETTTPAIATETGAATTGAGATGVGEGTTAIGAGEVAGMAGWGVVGGTAGGWIASQKSAQELTPWGGQKTERQMGGVAGGAAAGALYGSYAYPGVGTVVGAIVGGIVGGVSQSTVICTELNRQGYMPYEILQLDKIYRLLYIDDDVYEGYLTWAEPLVGLMRKSSIMTHIVKPFGLAWAYEMASRIKPDKYKGNIVGKIMLKTGVPVCRFINRVVNKKSEVRNGVS